jgi:hypothetical protein
VIEIEVTQRTAVSEGVDKEVVDEFYPYLLDVIDKTRIKNRLKGRERHLFGLAEMCWVIEPGE